MLSDPIARIRRFHRAVTSEVGVLDASFLGRGRPLGPARVLNAIGSGRRDIRDIRAYLGLDSGLMSRLLRSLEAEGLIEIEGNASDSRRRSARLTGAGALEYAAYEALSDAQAAEILDKHQARERLLAAMDLIATTLGRDRIVIEEARPGDPRSQSCLSAYYGELAARFERGFDVSLSADPEARDMERPRGSFLLAVSDGLPVGCVGLKGTDKGYAEVKRLWIAPAARGLGLSRRLMEELERIAIELGYDRLRLDTNSALPEAVGLYRNSGWTEIARFNDDPYPDLFFERIIAGAGARTGASTGVGAEPAAG
ncbi:bifunctional helix-turn-helix transcriptional regulator/GNAT family N-acetyltransferase [Pseudodonghicola xiamenensis]|uniref:PadR family transcriptional regulator n=1 Tax=Pseudodonghicola xiamenensis TaxID=337702 RepID=A0A8J3H508_9RHOB|nr:helix-turn-helix domain-containing GNAT family N-acetyltransferase [Pseudodonghicola xiamenensis]GHG80158.1 PadR family transcriptional regulator [Pseudodonghicola xiamenensis]